jgi:hypothetical protein
MASPDALTPADRATIGKIVTRYPGLAAAVHAQVTRLIAIVLPASDGAIATEAQLDALLESIVARVVVGSGKLRADPPTATDELVDTMVLLLARHSVAQARAGLVARVVGAKGERMLSREHDTEGEGYMASLVARSHSAILAGAGLVALLCLALLAAPLAAEARRPRQLAASQLDELRS